MKYGKIELNIPGEFPQAEKKEINGELFQRFEFSNGLVILTRTGKSQSFFDSNYEWNTASGTEWSPNYEKKNLNFVDRHFI